ncbi:MbnP family protein [Fluviicola sp.]|uniref:MbnP family protein n=1 Tax=Fluviicola sp. TaxID=1917219 RepID=UPI003D273342
MIRVLVYWFFLLPLFSWSQLTIDVNLTLDKQLIGLNQTLSLNEQSFQLEQARFYLSKFEFFQNNRLVAVDPIEAYLVDFEIDSTRKIIFPTIQADQIDEIRFLFGIDSVTNTSGAMTGALDPMYGMYWSWQSGYINCKLEGTVLTPKREAFQLHLGGYTSPFLAAQLIVLENSKTSATKLNIDLKSIMGEVVLSQSNLHVMSPCVKAVEYAQILAKSFDLKP